MAVEKHGTRRRWAWRKLHLGVDAETGMIVASTLTGKEGDNAAELDQLLDQIEQLVAAVIAEHHPAAAVVVPPRSICPCPVLRREPTRRSATGIFKSLPSRAP
jgi:Transposase DDE domain